MSNVQWISQITAYDVDKLEEFKLILNTNEIISIAEDTPICKIKLDRKKQSMLGSDKHHICLKGTNINDLYSSYHNRACNDRGLLQRGNTY